MFLLSGAFGSTGRPALYSMKEHSLAARLCALFPRLLFLRVMRWEDTGHTWPEDECTLVEDHVAIPRPPGYIRRDFVCRAVCRALQEDDPTVHRVEILND